jgi:hypothetical protein
VIDCSAKQCDYCHSSINLGQRWVREKIYDPALNGRDPSYHRYHAEPFAGRKQAAGKNTKKRGTLAEPTPTPPRIKL